MYVTISTYRAKTGEEDAIIALHEDWQRTHQPRTKGHLSGELLRNVNDSGEFVAIMRFEGRESARTLANDPERKAWHQRLMSLIEYLPVQTEYTSEWSHTT